MGQVNEVVSTQLELAAASSSSSFFNAKRGDPELQALVSGIVPTIFEVED